MGLLNDGAPVAEEVPIEDEMDQMPQQLAETTIKGAEALFYTSVQAIDTPNLGNIIMGQLEAADLSEATQLVMDQAVKVHVEQQLPITSPMVISATHFVALYLSEVAKQMGVEFDDGDIKGATFDYVDYHLAEVKGGRLLELQGEQQPPQGGPPMEEPMLPPEDLGAQAGPPAGLTGGM
jgi:hypothetical protein